MNSKVIRALGAFGAVAVVLLVAVLALRGGSDTDRTASATATTHAITTSTNSPVRSPATPPAAATDPLTGTDSLLSHGRAARLPSALRISSRAAAPVTD
ncbi:hypothetical protein APR12_004318 [Nocardia amikacinitolerans]|uniref:hypothetical protein n=1 Tax=Nocardia amikacinitolerans TaxID=756689 RepID=UPI00082E8D75|nr:hypothetical protein [Nocardia amikacinitolerans]MCP2318955.1 hypothetical protein [Nocardia amikacinitolerans]